MAVIPGGDEQQLVVSVESTLRVLSSNMSTVDAFECDGDINGSIAADEQFVYMIFHAHACRFATRCRHENRDTPA